MTPQRSSELNSAVECLNELIERITPPTEFELARLDGDIRRLGNVDVVESQCLRGMYYALQGDLENTTKWFDMALRSSPDNPRIYINYASMLSRLEQHERAMELALDGVSRESSPGYINILLLCAYYADASNVMDEWLPKYEKIAGKPHEVFFWLQEDAEDESEIAEMGDEMRKGPHTSWEDVKKELGL